MILEDEVNIDYTIYVQYVSLSGEARELQSQLYLGRGKTTILDIVRCCNLSLPILPHTNITCTTHNI